MKWIENTHRIWKYFFNLWRLIWFCGPVWTDVQKLTSKLKSYINFIIYPNVWGISILTQLEVTLSQGINLFWIYPRIKYFYNTTRAYCKNFLRRTIFALSKEQTCYKHMKEMHIQVLLKWIYWWDNLTISFKNQHISCFRKVIQTFYGK